MKKLLSSFKNLDFFSENYKLEENLSTRHNSTPGAMVSLLIFIMSLVLGYLFGKEIFERKQPLTSNSQQYNKDSVVFLKNMPLAINFYDRNGKNLKNIFNYIDIQVVLYDIDAKLNTTIDFSLKITNCLNVNFERHNNLKDELAKKVFDYYCINHTNTTSISKGYAEADSRFIDIIIRPCDPKLRICPNDTNDVLSLLFVSTTFVNSYYDSNNYTDPIQYYYYTFNVQISNKLNKRQFLRFTNNKYISDNGWILENLAIYDYVTLRDVKVDINPIREVLPSMLGITLESPRIKDTTLRSYLKIYELIAKIGGLVKGLNIVASLFTSLYFQYAYKIHLVKMAISEKGFGIKQRKKAIDKSNLKFSINNRKISNPNYENQIKETLQNLNKENKFEQEIWIYNNENELNNEENENNILHSLKLKENPNSNILNKESLSNLKRFEKRILEKDVLKDNSNVKIAEFSKYSNESDEILVSEILNNFKFFDYLKAMLFCNKDLRHKNQILSKFVSKNFSYSKIIHHINNYDEILKK